MYVIVGLSNTIRKILFIKINEFITYKKDVYIYTSIDDIEILEPKDFDIKNECINGFIIKEDSVIFDYDDTKLKYLMLKGL